MIYAFILGNNQALSIAEIISVLERDSFVFVILSITQKAIVIKLDKNIENPQEFLDRLGGTIKIAHIFDTKEGAEKTKRMVDFAINGFKEQKFIFGISSYGTSSPRLGFEIKKELKMAGVNSRFVQGKDKALTAPEIKNNKMLSHGADFVVIKDQSDFFLGNTLAIQDYESYSYRDYERPRRNAKSGMLPPKVAQIMINLIPKKPIQIYDPFCGQGTILQEASLMGIKSIGSDISEKRVHDTKRNLEWLNEKYKLRIAPENMVFQADALDFKARKIKVASDSIVSEVYLGPPLTEKVSEKEIRDTVKELDKKYDTFFRGIKTSSPKIKYIVLALPFYKTKNAQLHLKIIDDIKKIGYNVLSPIENHEIKSIFFSGYRQEKKTFLYSRLDQIVGREIIILEKK